jgi:hypothetical protein
MVIGLSGNNPMSENNLFGYKNLKPENQIKKKIVDKLLIPLFQKKWDKVNENYILFGNRFRSIKDEIYVYLLKTIELLLHEIKIKQHTNEPELVFVLPPIKLKPEYEVYKLIFGIPKQYDKEILERIRQLLKKENITIDKIKSYL